ncbi:MAG TPA: hypothetical protein VE525_19690 [Rubrobacter sp.]|nr:hypothetical protein [Rubrobacter sp.]
MKEKIDVVAERLHGASGVEYGRAARAIEHYEKAGHGSFSTTMKYYTRVPADLQKQAAEAWGSSFSAPRTGPPGVLLPSRSR